MATFRKMASGWQAVVRKKGHAAQYKVFPKKILAERWARQVENDLAEKLHVNALAASTLTRSLLNKYGEKITPRKRSAKKELSRLSILSEHLGDLMLSELGPEQVIGFVDDRLGCVVSDTVRKEINTLKVVIDAGMALWGIHLPANPVVTAKGVLKVTKTLQPGVRRERRPSDNELALLLDSDVADLVEFAIETGMRRGEIANIKPTHRRGELLNIPETKTDTPRLIPLSKRAQVLLDEVGGSWGVMPNSMTQAFNRECARLGIEGLRFHDLRHEATSRFIEKGLNVAEVASITGHNLQSLQRYTHIKPQLLVARL